MASRLHTALGNHAEDWQAPLNDENERLNRDAASKRYGKDPCEDNPVNPRHTDTIGDLVNRRYGRRSVVKGALAVRDCRKIKFLIFGSMRIFIYR